MDADTAVEVNFSSHGHSKRGEGEIFDYSQVGFFVHVKLLHNSWCKGFVRSLGENTCDIVIVLRMYVHMHRWILGVTIGRVL